MKTKILAIAAITLFAAAMGGCTVKYSAYLTPKEGGASGNGTMTFAGGERRMEVHLSGKTYHGQAICSLRDHSLFKVGYFKCSAQMNSGDHTLLCNFEIGTGGAGDGECKASDGKSYGLQVSAQ